MRTRFGQLFDFSKLSSVSGCMKFRNQRASGSGVFENFKNQRTSSSGLFELFLEWRNLCLVPSCKTLKRTCRFQGITGKVSEFWQVPRFFWELRLYIRFGSWFSENSGYVSGPLRRCFFDGRVSGRIRLFWIFWELPWFYILKNCHDNRRSSGAISHNRLTLGP